ncbi:hypothetical protein [Saccharospirillum alexandrii]|uniref:hypothetical protein n=1 Tax=Saccharospirillum alexandrii TaxID=2448477 RepID=UPI000FDA17D1|nr:hypothetical protein [Saccharospirillum alexandrii]
MKAIKIASGVAVSALALAISAQANAAAHEGMATETEWSFTGSMEFLTVVDMAAGAVNRDGDATDTVIDVELDEEDDFDEGAAGDAWGLETTLSVVHGPFSGGFILTGDDESDVSVELDDLVVTDGAISFGQTGSLVDETHEYAYDMDDSGDSAAARSEGRDVGAALRYTMEGLKVQVEGSNRKDASGDGVVTGIDATGANGTDSSDFGVAAQYMGEADALSYVAEAQFRTSSLGGDDDSPYTYFGVGATYTMDIVTAKFGLNQYSVTTSADAHDDAILEYGFELTATPIDALSVYLKGQDLDSGDVVTEEAMKLLAGAAYTVDTLTFTGEYLFTDAEEVGDEIFAEVAYASGMIGAYGSVTLANIDAETGDAPLIEAGVSYTQENGVKYAADYDLRAEETDATINQAEINRFRLTAAYAF